MIIKMTVTTTLMNSAEQLCQEKNDKIEKQLGITNDRVRLLEDSNGVLDGDWRLLKVTLN